MTTSSSEDTASIDVDLESDEQIVPFVHNLGGEVDVQGYDAAGNPVGHVVTIPVTAMEVEVVVLPGTVARLTAQLQQDHAL